MDLGRLRDWCGRGWYGQSSPSGLLNWGSWLEVLRTVSARERGLKVARVGVGYMAFGFTSSESPWESRDGVASSRSIKLCRPVAEPITLAAAPLRRSPSGGSLETERWCKAGGRRLPLEAGRASKVPSIRSTLDRPRVMDRLLLLVPLLAVVEMLGAGAKTRGEEGMFSGYVSSCSGITVSDSFGTGNS